jgi:NADPH:quinone reductase-like Zn-dependent oxidoreductase
MRQVVIPRYGAADVLEVREAPVPAPPDAHVRIRVRAAGVNFADILARLGLYPDAPPPPMVAGYEVAGIVDAVGSGVTALHEGDRALAFTRFGGYSDYVVVPASLAFRFPDELSDAEAAAVPVSYLTAAIALHRLAGLTAGETVLVQNAGGGLGIAATQLARLRRAIVYGTASAGKHGAIASFGIEHAIDYRHANVLDEVLKLTRGRGVDVVLDPVGGASFAESYRMLAPMGRLIMVGMSSVAGGERRSPWRAFRAWRALPRFDPLSLINRNRGVFGLNVGHLWDERRQLHAVMDGLMDDLKAGRIQPVVARAFPLERAADAHRFIQARSNIGKVVLTT